MAEQAIILIPDISGFTGFTGATEIDHAAHIITELPELIVASNETYFTLAEIEGDAVLFAAELQRELDGRKAAGREEARHDGWAGGELRALQTRLRDQPRLTDRLCGYMSLSFRQSVGTGAQTPDSHMLYGETAMKAAVLFSLMFMLVMLPALAQSSNFRCMVVENEGDKWIPGESGRIKTFWIAPACATLGSEYYLTGGGYTFENPQNNPQENWVITGSHPYDQITNKTPNMRQAANSWRCFASYTGHDNVSGPPANLRCFAMCCRWEGIWSLSPKD
jgi:hypothetical protein